MDLQDFNDDDQGVVQLASREQMDNHRAMRMAIIGRTWPDLDQMSHVQVTAAMFGYSMDTVLTRSRGLSNMVTVATNPAASYLSLRLLNDVLTEAIHDLAQHIIALHELATHTQEMEGDDLIDFIEGLVGHVAKDHPDQMNFTCNLIHQGMADRLVDHYKRAFVAALKTDPTIVDLQLEFDFEEEGFKGFHPHLAKRLPMVEQLDVDPRDINTPRNHQPKENNDD